jgi:hypothetical protein
MEGKKNEKKKKTKNDGHEKNNEQETKSYIITAMKCVLKCHFLIVKYELGGSCW